MAEIPTERVNQLVIRAAASRKALSDASKNLKSSAEIGRRLQSSVRNHQTAWLGSAAVLGLILAKLPSRKKKVYINNGSKTATTDAAAKGGMFVAFLGLILQLARPVLQKFLVEQVGLYADKYRTRQAKTTVAPR